MTINSSATTVDLQLRPNDPDLAKPATGSDYSFSLRDPINLPQASAFVVYSPAAERYHRLRRAIADAGIPMLSDDEVRDEIRSRRSDNDD